MHLINFGFDKTIHITLLRAMMLPTINRYTQRDLHPHVKFRILFVYLFRILSFLSKR